MKQQRHRLAWGLIVVATLAACSQPVSMPSAAVPTSTVTVVPFVTSPLPTREPVQSTASGCNRSQLLGELAPLVPYAEASLSHNAIYNVHTLNLWFVDPEIDPFASAGDIPRYTDLALSHAAAVSHTLALASACVASSFDGITVRVVDREYNEWYTGQVDPRLIPLSPEVSGEQAAQLARSFVEGYRRSTRTTPASEPAPPGSCTWPQAHARLQALFQPDQRNATSYFVRDDKGANAWVQWEGPQDFDVFLADVARIANVLPCLAPMDTLWLIYVDAEGETLLILAADGDAVRTVDPARLVDYLEVIYPAPQ